MVHARTDSWIRRLGLLACLVVALTAGGAALAQDDPAPAGHDSHAAEPGQVKENLKKVGVHAVNFVLFVALIVYVARRPLKDFLANRRLAVARELDESAQLKTEAQAAFVDAKQRIEQMDQRLVEMMESVRRQCEVEGQRAKERAEETSQNIDDTTHRTIAEETDKARHELRAETVELAVEMARDVLTQAVSAEDHRRIASSYMDRMAEES